MKGCMEAFNAEYREAEVVQSHSWESKWVVDTCTHRVDSFFHIVVHKVVHEKLHKVSHGMSHEKLHSQGYGELLAMDREMIQKNKYDLPRQQEVLDSEILPCEQSQYEHGQQQYFGPKDHMNEGEEELSKMHSKEQGLRMKGHVKGCKWYSLWSLISVLVSAYDY